MSPDEFWNMTYYEFSLALKGYKQLRDHHMADAWWNAQLNSIGYHQPKKFPKLNSIIKPDGAMDDKKRDDIKDFLNTRPKTKKRKDN